MIWDFLQVFTKVRSGQKLFADDKIDKLNRSFTVILLIIASIFIGSKNFGQPISCLKLVNEISPITSQYIDSVCWVKDSIILDNFFESAVRDEGKKEERTNTYPWLTLICLALSLTYYIPYILWKYFVRKNTYNNVPIDISLIVETIKSSSLQENDDFSKKIKLCASYLDRCFSLNNFNDSCLGELEDFSKYFQNERFENREPRTYADRLKKRKVKFFHVPLLLKYVLVKLVYTVISVSIFFLIDKIAKFRESFLYFGINMVLKFNSSSAVFKEKITNSYFPRHILCDINYMGDLKSPQSFRYQCTLPANFFNEIVFLVLWTWFIILAVLNIFSLIKWILKICFRKMIITNMLVWPFRYKYNIELYIDSFVKDYLNTEGFLALMLIKSNTQDWHCRNIVRLLWNYYVDRLKQEVEIPTPRLCDQKSNLFPSGSTIKVLNRREFNYEPLSASIATPVRSSYPPSKTEFNEFDLYCEKFIDLTGVCYVQVIYHNFTTDEIRLKYDGKLSNPMNLVGYESQTKYFGVQLQINSYNGQVSDTLFQNSNTRFLLANSEFKNAAAITGFEYFGLKSGIIKIEIVTFTFCAVNYPCSSYFKDNYFIKSNQMITLKSYEIPINTGYNFYHVSYDNIEKRSMVVITQLSGALGIDSTDDRRFISDYLFDSVNDYYKITKIDFSKNSAVLFKVEIDFAFSYNMYATEIKLTNPGTVVFEIYADLLAFNKQFIDINDDSSLETLCIKKANETDFNLNCAANGFSFRKLNLKIKVNETTLPLSISEDFINYFGVLSTNIPKSSIENSFSYFIIPNAEIKFESVLYNVNLYASKSGAIEIGFLNFSVCGQVGESCWRYFYSNSIMPTAKVVYNWTFSLKNGYNSIPVNNAIVYKGLIPYISYVELGRVEIEAIDSFIYSDYAFYDSQRTRIIKISNEIPSRFLINFNIDQFYLPYQKMISLSVVSTNELTIKSYFEQKNDSESQLKLNFASKKYLQLAIVVNGSILDREISFELTAISQLYSEFFFSIHESIEQIYSLNGSYKNYFGFDSLSNQVNTKYLYYNGLFLMNNAEFLTSENLIGFDISASDSGLIEILVLSIDDCKDQNLCSEYLNRTMMIKNYTVIDRVKLLINTKVQRYYIPKIKMLKSYMVAFEYNGGNIKASECSECIYSDYILRKDGTLIKDANYGTKNYRFLLNCIIETGYYVFKLSDSVKYSHTGEFDLTVGLKDKTLASQINVTVVEKQFLDFYCKNLIDLEVKCHITGVSLARDTEFLVTGDSNFIEYSINKTAVVDFFGIDFLNYNVVESNLYRPMSSEYILLNTEFLFDAYMIGFRVHALTSGLLYARIVEFGDICKEANSSCASTFKTDTILQNLNPKLIFYQYISKNDDIFYLDKRYVKKGSMILLRFTDNLVGYEENGDHIYSDMYLYGSQVYPILPNTKFRFIFNVIIDLKYYLTNIEFSIMIQKRKEKDTLTALIKSKDLKESLTKNFEIIEKRQFLDLRCASSNFTIDCEIIAVSFSKDDSVEILNGNQLINIIPVGDQIISYFGIEFSQKLSAKYETPKKFFILSSSEFKFDSSLIGFEIYAKKGYSQELNIIDFGDQCGIDSCSFYLSNNIGLPINYNTTFTVTINFVQGYNKIFLNRKVNIRKGSMIGLSYYYSNDYFNFNNEFSNMRDYYIDRFLYIAFGKRLMIRALIDEEFYLMKSDFSIQVQNYGVYTIFAKLILNSSRTESVVRKIYLSENLNFKEIDSQEIDNPINPVPTNRISIKENTDPAEKIESITYHSPIASKETYTTTEINNIVSFMKNMSFIDEIISDHEIEEIVTLNSFSSLVQLPISAALDYLKSKIDMGDCLANCSNNGRCKIENGLARCVCRKFFMGKMCNLDMRKCASNPCLNNGTCIESFNLDSYKCDCGNLFYGENCQFKIDVCKNHTCSGNGYCVDQDDEPKCVCKYLFSGKNCEIESDEIKQIRKTVSGAKGVAIAAIVLFYSIFIFFDLMSFFASYFSLAQTQFSFVTIVCLISRNLDVSPRMHNAQHLAASSSPTKSSSSISSASSELMSSCSSNGSASGIKRRPHIKKPTSTNEESMRSNSEKSTSKNSSELPEIDLVPPNTLSLHSLCSTNNDSFLKDGFPFHIYDNCDGLTNYEYCSFDTASSSTNTQEMDTIDPSIDENTKNVSKNIRSRIEKLILSYKEVSQQAGKVHFMNDLTFNFDENFTANLFEIFFTSNYKVLNFRQIQTDLIESNVAKNVFLVLAKLGHECFKLNLLSVCEYLLEFAVCRVDTNSSKLKIATLSTLSACYWRQSKFVESIDCMKNEVELIDFLSNEDSVSDASTIVYSNKYRIFGNMASAYQRIDKIGECLNIFQLQLNLAIELNDIKLIVNTLNSIGLVHNKLKDYQCSLDFFQKSLGIIQSSESLDHIICQRLSQKQYNLIAEAFLKLADYDQAKEYFVKELEISDEIQELHFEMVKEENQNSVVIEDMEQFNLNLSIVTLNLGFVFSKLKSYQSSLKYYEKCLEILNNNFSSSNPEPKTKQQTIEIYGRVYIGLINGNLQSQDNLHGLLYAHTMLDFTLKEMVKLNMEQNQLKQELSEHSDIPSSTSEMIYDQRFRYLKYLEMSACSKLATCYAKQDRLNDAYKLYQREATIALQLNNVLHLTRAYSHMAQIDFVNKNYEQCIDLYKQILNVIEQKLLKTDETESNRPKDERLIQMIYYTLSNIGLCMEMMNKTDEALLMFKEQYEISKLLKNLKSQANALLNLVNIYLTKCPTGENQVPSLKESKEGTSQSELINLLLELNQVYIELDDLNGQFFTSQCLAYSYHTSGKFKRAIDFYLTNVKIGTSLNQLDNVNKSIFNLSLCHKALENFEQAYEYQVEYLSKIENEEKSDYRKFVSMGLMADLMLAMGPINQDICQQCIQMHIDRLKIIKSSSENSIEKAINSQNKCKLISDCLEAISKCYSLLNDNQQVLKFKLLQLELQSEMEASSDKSVALGKQKCRLLLEIGNIFLFKFDDPLAGFKHFEQAWDMCKNSDDILLESIILGNLGLCKQKVQDYHSAIEFYKKQIFTLNKRLNALDRTDNNISVTSADSNSSSELVYRMNSDSPVIFSPENFDTIKEICSIRIDVGRAYAKLAKCTHFLSFNKINPQAYLIDAQNFYQEYCRECEFLYDKYVKSFMMKFSESETSENGSEKSLGNDLNQKLKDLCDQIYTDFDNSISKLAMFIAQYKPERAIRLNEKRSRLLSIVSQALLDSHLLLELNVKIFYELAILHSKLENNSAKSLDYCTNIINIFGDQESSGLDEMYLVEALGLSSDIRVSKFWQSEHYEEELKRLVQAYRLSWRQAGSNDSKILELKYESMCRLCSFYRRSSQTKECLEVLMDSLGKFGLEFQKLQDNLNQSDRKSLILLQYIEYLFFIHRKIALIHLNHASESQNAKSKQILFLALKHVNESLMHLNYLKEFESSDETELRLASIYCLFGKCHKYLKNSEMELEMFANSLDIYENVIQSNGSNGSLDQLIVSDCLITRIDARGFSHLFEDFRLDFDEESRIGYRDRLDHLYQHIEDALIRMAKHKEAILVTERHKNKLCPHLNNLPDLLTFDQIDKIFDQNSNLVILYFSRVDISQTLNCWLIYWNSSLSMCDIKFHQINYKSFDSLFMSKIGGAKSECAKFWEEILVCDNEDRNTILHHLYNLLLRPFEELIFNQKQKKMLSIVYDQSMLKFPFHLIKHADVETQAENFIFELLDIDSMFSIKYLIKSKMYNQRYTKHQNDYSFTIPMKVIASDAEMEKLLTGKPFSKSNQYHFDLILFLFNSENKSLEWINHLINSLISKKITKSVLLQFIPNYGQVSKKDLEISEQNARAFLKKLYSKMLNRTTLNSTLVFNTLKLEQKPLFSYLLFGKLSIYQIQNVLVNEQTNQSTTIISPLQKSLLNDSMQKPIEQNEEKITKDNVCKDKGLEDVLLELTQDNAEVSLSQVFVQYLKLNSKLGEQATQVLEITIFFLNDLLNGSLMSIETIGFIHLYEKFSTSQLHNSIITSSRLMLKRLGFSFYIDKDGKYMVKLPSKALNSKFKLISKVLNELKIFSSKILKEFYEISKSAIGKELLILIKQHQTNLKTQNTQLIMRTKTYRTFENFLNNFTKNKEEDVSENKTQLEIESDIFNRINLFATIVLSDSSKNEAEKSLEDFVDFFFKKFDKNDEHENESQYSTLSSIIGLQKNTEKISEGDQEIKIYKESNFANHKFGDHNSRIHKMIEINVDTQSETPYVYDKYLSELLDNDMNYCSTQTERRTFTKEWFESETVSKTKSESDKFDGDFRCNSFIKLEEKEYMDQIITTTTTIRKLNNDDLFMICDSNLNDMSEHPIIQTDLIVNKLTPRTSKEGNIPGLKQNINNFSINKQTDENEKNMDQNQNIYHCLTNYTYEQP
ncbi:Tetratricopeptide repeat 28 [Brachionus plicatilis]|uniref:Innexin n=1 Tax=Brachionus plicatilis TaxID=10195 RepID=A0A3M7RHS7_BRAPC|nr:Tetratricopeptide repeat 28 [Brachionus plicatilis]